MTHNFLVILNEFFRRIPKSADAACRSCRKIISTLNNDAELITHLKLKHLENKYVLFNESLEKLNGF